MVWENNFFYILILNAITGMVAYGLFKLIIRFTNDRFGCYSLYYHLLRGVEIFFAIPFAYLYVKLIRGANIYKGITGYDGNEVVAAIFHVIFIVWVIGAVKKAFSFKEEYHKYKMLCNTNIPYSDPRIEDIFYNLYPHRRLKRVKIYQNFLASSPCVMGVIAPKLVLPEQEYNDDTMRIILAHEATHVIHRDNLWKRIGLILVIACWWNPTFRYILRDWAEWTETQCDLTVCRKFLDGDCRDYAYTLIGSSLASEGIMPLGVSSFKDNQSVRRRIERMSNFKRSKGRVVLSAVLSAIFIAGSSLTAFAAGNATSEVGVTAYLNTLDTRSEDLVTIDLDSVDNVNVFRMTPEEMAEKGITVQIVEAEDGIATFATQKYFDWNILAGDMAASANFLKRKDMSIEVSAYITSSSSVHIGVIEPDGTFVYGVAPANTTSTLKYTTIRLGYYKVAVYNITSSTINANGFYVR